jgi:hypothetical protein
VPKCGAVIMSVVAVVRLESNMSRVNGVTGMSDMTIVNNDGCECKGEQEGSDGRERSGIYMHECMRREF